MIIKDKRVPKSGGTDVWSVVYGSIVEWEDDFWILTQGDRKYTGESDQVVFINLVDGSSIGLTRGTKVRVVEAELIIKGKKE